MGSILSRAINGSSPLVASMAASSVIIFLHWLFAFGAFQHHKIGIVHHDDLRQVKAARLERTGKLSFILNASKP
ncbi:hypothetical protein [Legionella sainthelensi]|nr:hypothetical protein [Legionella sainthelensi]